MISNIIRLNCFSITHFAKKDIDISKKMWNEKYYYNEIKLKIEWSKKY